MRTRRTTVLLSLAASLIPAAVARAEIAVRTIDPLRPASGQVVLVVADALPLGENRALADLRVFVEQDGAEQEAFVFRSAALPDAICARLPDGLRPGQALLALALGAEAAGEPLEFEVGEHPPAPALWTAYRYGEGDTPIELVHAGERVVVVGTGMDTTGVTLTLRHEGGLETVLPVFAHTSPTVGVAAVVDLPADLPPGSLWLSARVRVCEPLEACRLVSESADSDALELTVE